ncbi:hypothetical protein QAD02_011488 [Eretmocerus hayati]|uniref:Uncharacterized protein n=1 Tax=Eretmocerus hayati TaxID=131215 RepID=A0ACC2NZT5_9HYME|nr:hypothetical protein QAD02_011488 [Eretmocerus hayati]
MATPSAHDQSENTILYRKITQFCYAVHMDNEMAVLEFLKNGYDINATIPPDNPFKNFSSELDGVSALHFACEQSTELVGVLLNNGADFTLKNSVESTPLHASFEYVGSFVSRVTDYISDDDCIAPQILSSHVKNNITINPVNKHGLSHFHIACIMSYLETMQLFVDNGIQINEPIHEDSPVLPGYTALHIASRFGSLGSVKLLVNRGADVHARNRDGLVPLQLIFSRLEEFSFLALRRDSFENHWEFYQKLQVDTYGIAAILIPETFRKCPKSVNQIIDRGVDINAPTDFGFTALHCASLVDFDVTKLLLERGANFFLQSGNNPMPVDICTWKYGYEIMKLLPSVQNLAKHINQESQSWRIALALHDNENLKDLLSDNEVVQEINTACLSSDSPVWPGATALHLAIMFARNDPRSYDPQQWWKDLSNHSYPTDVIQILISRGASIIQQDASGQMPVHTAFYLKRFDFLSVLLEPHFRPDNGEHFVSRDNPLDETGLSHVHIVCMTGNQKSMVTLLSNDASPNEPIRSDLRICPDFEKPVIVLRAGSTPLHIAVRLKKIESIKTLIASRSDISAKDADGLTPIDLMVSKDGLDESGLVDVLLSLIFNYCVKDSIFVVDAEILKHLEILCIAIDPLTFHMRFHIDIMQNHSDFVHLRKMLLAQPDDDFEHMKMVLDLVQMMREFTCRSFDSNVKAVKCMNSLKKILQKDPKNKPLDSRCFKSYVELLPIQHEKLVVLDEQTHMTNLHLACALHRQDWIESLVKSGADLNCRMSSDSPIFSGYTPLHLAVRCSRKENVDIKTCIKSMKIMLKNKADPTIQDVNDETPLHLADRYGFIEIKHLLLLDDRITHKNLVSRYDRSHFHIACSSVFPKVVETFLKQGADPNELNYISDDVVWQAIPSNKQAIPSNKIRFSFTPLDDAEDLEVVRVLLKHGADPKIEDYKGYTALHYAASHCCSVDVIKTLVRDGGVDVNSRPVLHFTALDLLVTERMEEYDTESHIRSLLELGARINHKNFEASSTFARAIEAHDVKLLQILVKHGMDANDLNEHKRTALHELFIRGTYYCLNDSNKYITIINELCEKGIDIDCQDSFKQTPLHITVFNGLKQGTSALLASGADINATDYKSRTPITLLLTDDRVDEEGLKVIRPLVREELSEIFIKHLRKMQAFKLPLKSQNKAVDVEQISEDPELFTSNIIREFERSDEMEKMKNISLKENVTLHDVMHMDSHQLISLIENDALMEVLESQDFHEKFPEFGGILKLKFRSALRRKAINSARKALYLILKMQIPETCTEIVVSCLNNEDLKILSESGFK